MTPRDWNSASVDYSYDLLRIGGFEVMFRREAEAMERMVQELIIGEGSVLEIGFGMGIAAAAIRKKGNPHTVVELNQYIAEDARSQGYNVIEVDYRKHSGVYDYVFADPFLFDEEGTLGEQILKYVKKFMHRESRITWFGSDDGDLENRAKANFRDVQIFRHDDWRFAICQSPI